MSRVADNTDKNNRRTSKQKPSPALPCQFSSQQTTMDAGWHVVIWALGLFALAAGQSFSETIGKEQSCHSFAGGNVYPYTWPHGGDHKLQWTKAVSKYRLSTPPVIEECHFRQFRFSNMCVKRSIELLYFYPWKYVTSVNS